MDIQTIILVLGSSGLGGIIGSYFQQRWNKDAELYKIHWTRFSEIELRIQTIKEERYRSTLIWMRIFLKPQNLHHFNLDDHNFTNHKIVHSMKDDEIKKYSKEKITEFYHNGFLYAPDDVMKAIKYFLENPSE